MLIYWYKITIFTLKLPQIKQEINGIVSVIIAVRNEENSINYLINDLLLQEFPILNLEIIIIDDHSTDNTSTVIESSIKNYQHIKLLQLPNNFQGKKQAISYGIAHTKGELIITTDADCRVNKTWIVTIFAFYQQKNAKIISSLVKFSPINSNSPQKQLLNIFQILDFSALIGIGAASIALQKPTMCNGANLAYTKAIFEEVEGFEGNEQIASGDDEFLLQKIAAKYPQDIYFLKNTEVIVSTEAQNNLYDFFQQRKRWASKWNIHKQWNVRLLAFFIVSIHFISLLLPFLAFFDTQISFFAILFWIVKIIFEAIFVGAILNFLGYSKYIFFMPLASFIYPFYAIIVGIAANQKKFHWKNRQYN